MYYYKNKYVKKERRKTDVNMRLINNRYKKKRRIKPLFLKINQ